MGDKLKEFGSGAHMRLIPLDFLAMRIQMSETTRRLLDKVGGFYYEKRGTVNLKGKGKTTTVCDKASLMGSITLFCSLLKTNIAKEIVKGPLP